MTKQQVFDVLGGLPDDMILHAASPSAEAAAERGTKAEKQAKKQSRRERWELVVTSGWFVAAVCALVAGGVLFGIIRMGNTSGPGQVGAETKQQTPSERLGIDEYHSMRADVPYTLSFTTNGDGTCTLTRVDVNLLYEGPITLTIPSVSPEGDRVSGIDLDGLSPIPLFLEDGDFRAMMKPVGDALGEDSFPYKKVLALYGGSDGALSKDRAPTAELPEELLTAFPIVEKLDLWMFDPSASASDRAYAAGVLAANNPQFDALTAYGYLMKLQAAADAYGLPMPMELSDFDAGGAGIEVIVLPDTLTYVDEGSFGGCSSLKEIRTAMTMTALESVRWLYDIPEQEARCLNAREALSIIYGKQMPPVDSVRVVCGDGSFDVMAAPSSAPYIIRIDTPVISTSDDRVILHLTALNAGEEFWRGDRWSLFRVENGERTELAFLGMDFAVLVSPKDKDSRAEQTIQVIFNEMTPIGGKPLATLPAGTYCLEHYDDRGTVIARVDFEVE